MLCVCSAGRTFVEVVLEGILLALSLMTVDVMHLSHRLAILSEATRLNMPVLGPLAYALSYHYIC